MTGLAELLDQMRVHASVDGGAVSAVLHDRQQVDISFAPGFYRRATDAVLEEHLASLARLLRVEYDRQYYAVLSKASGETITKDPPPVGWRDTEYVTQREELIAEGASAGRRIVITARGLQSWRVSIAPGTVYDLDETQFADQVGEAAAGVIRSQFAGIRALKARVYG